MRVLRLRGFLAGGLVFVALTRSGAAEAQEKGRVQLSLQTTLFGYSHDETQPDSSSGAEAYESSSWRAGLEGPGLGAGVGYQWGHWLVGLRTSFSTNHVTPSTGAYAQTASQWNSQVSLMPRLEYLFGRGDVRPFVAGMVGYRHTWGSGVVDMTIDSQPYHSEGESSSDGITFGGALGLHGFLEQWFSVDPEVALLGASAKSRNDASSSSLDGSGNVYNSWKGSSNAFAIMVNVGLSGWL